MENPEIIMENVKKITFDCGKGILECRSDGHGQIAGSPKHPV